MIDTQLLISGVIFGLSIGSIFFLMAIGLSLCFGLMRIISNLFWLWTFGTILQDRLGNNRLIPVYIYGGILGALFFILVHYLPTPLQAHTNFASLMGANAAVMAVATAATFIAPDYRFFAHMRKGMPIWVMLALFVFIDLAGVAQNNPAYAIAHLGGGIAGWIFIYFIKRNIDIGNWMNTSYHFITHIFSPAKIESKQTIKNKVFYNTGSRTPYQKTALINEQKINQILVLRKQRIDLKLIHKKEDQNN
jgi:hypothetical protein